MAIPRIDLVTWFNRLQAFPMGTQALDRVLWRVVPFNLALKPHVIGMTNDDVSVAVGPLRRGLTNHLGSMHAAVLFTAAEYVQGLLIMSNAGRLGAELILKSLSIDYTAKAKGG